MTTPTARTRDRREVVSQYLLWAVDLGLAALIFVAPLFMGGRHPVGRLAFVVCACWMAIAWSLHQCFSRRATWNWSGVEWLLLAGLGVLILQLAPLSPAMLQRLSPTIRELLPLWEGGPAAASLGAWNQVSLTPVETRGGLVMYLAYAMMFVVVAQRIRSLEDAERILRWIALAAIGMAVLGLAQFLFGNGKFLWFYEHPFRNTVGVAKGSFSNQNHFAHFLALGIGPLVWWIQRSGSRRRGDLSRSARKRHSSHSHGTSPGFAWTGHSPAAGHGLDVRVRKQLLCVGLGVVLFAGLLTFSRGGVLALSLATVVCVVAYLRAGLLGRRALIAMALFVALVGVALSIYGYEPLTRRLEILANSQSVEDACHGRHALWKAHSLAIPKFAILGTGVGSHREVYPIYMSEYFDGEFSHAESGYLHLLLETGFSGLGCMLLGIGIAVTWGLRAFGPRPESEGDQALLAALGAVAAGICASAAHSVADFVWYIPACMSLTVILVACASRLRGMTSPSSPDNSLADPLRPSSRIAWACATVATTVLGFAMVQDRLPAALASPHWEGYQRAVRQARGESPTDAARTEQSREQSEHLRQTLAFHPADARANLRMAAVLMHRFELEQKTAENPMGLSQIRDAALASRFSTFDALNSWLNVAVGRNRPLLDAALAHAQRAVRLCPLQGEAYVCMAELSFLDPTHTISKSDYIAQAEKVRPYEGTVLFAVGSEAALMGDIGKTLEYWKKAFHQDPSVQSMIIQSTAPVLPVELLLGHFQPGLAGLGELHYFYRGAQRRAEATLTGRYYAEALSRRAEKESSPILAAARLHEAQGVYEFLGDLRQAIACQRQATERAPDNYQMRVTLASLLLREQRCDEAAEQLQWCLRRQPDDQQAVSLLAQANRLRLSRRPAGTDSDSRLQ